MVLQKCWIVMVKSMKIYEKHSMLSYFGKTVAQWLWYDKILKIMVTINYIGFTVEKSMALYLKQQKYDRIFIFFYFLL